MLQGLRNLNVLVIGDAIVDEYHFVEPLGQSTKGANLSVRFGSQEQFAGALWQWLIILQVLLRTSPL